MDGLKRKHKKLKAELLYFRSTKNLEDIVVPGTKYSIRKVEDGPISEVLRKHNKYPSTISSDPDVFRKSLVEPYAQILIDQTIAQIENIERDIEKEHESTRARIQREQARIQREQEELEEMKNWKQNVKDDIRKAKGEPEVLQVVQGPNLLPQQFPQMGHAPIPPIQHGGVGQYPAGNQSATGTNSNNEY